MRVFDTVLLILISTIRIAKAAALPSEGALVVEPGRALVGEALNHHDIDSHHPSSETKQLDPTSHHNPPTLHARKPLQTRLYADETTCAGPRLAAVQDAIRGVPLLAQAALNSLSPESYPLKGNPAPYFFGPQRYPYPYVSARFEDALAYATRSGFGRRIRVTCTDELASAEYGSCESPDRPLAYVLTPHEDVIILCDDFFFYPSLGTPCVGGLSQDGLTGIGGTTRAQTVLHEFMHAVTRGMIVDYAYGSVASHKLLPIFAVYNADSYARFAGWAYDLGFAEVSAKAKQCLEMFRPGVGFAGEFPPEGLIRFAEWVEGGTILSPPPAEPQ